MTHILIVGRGFTTFNNYLTEHGYTYTILRDAATTKPGHRPRPGEIVADFTTWGTLEQAVKNLPVRPDGVVTIYENYVRDVAQIAHLLGLPGMPLSAAQACTDKALMRQLFAQAPKPISPAFQEVTTWDQVAAFAAAHQFPLMLKPANLVKSLLVMKANDLAELQANWQHMTATIADVYAQWAPHASPKIVVEEYLSGHVYSTDAFVDATGVPHVLPHIVDYQTGYEMGYDDNFHYSRLLPSQLSATDQEKLLHCAALGCQALGMRSSPAHIEIIMTPAGPRIVEIGARNGGYRERMYRLSLGLDIYANALYTAIDHPLELEPTRHEPVAVLELFPHETGTFVEVAHEAELQTLPSLEYYKCKRTPGEPTGKSRDGYKFSAVVILHHANPAQFARDLAFVNDNVRIVTA